MRELTTLRASLPVEYGAGIWVRMDEDRPQILKALVSGPMDTPYAHGLFEFDILLPAQYPYVPPKVNECKCRGMPLFGFGARVYMYIGHEEWWQKQKQTRCCW